MQQKSLREGQFFDFHLKRKQSELHKMAQQLIGRKQILGLAVIWKFKAEKGPHHSQFAP